MVSVLPYLALVGFRAGARLRPLLAAVFVAVATGPPMGT